MKNENIFSNWAIKMQMNPQKDEFSVAVCKTTQAVERQQIKAALDAEILLPHVLSCIEKCAIKGENYIFYPPDETNTCCICVFEFFHIFFGFRRSYPVLDVAVQHELSALLRKRGFRCMPNSLIDDKLCISWS